MSLAAGDLVLVPFPFTDLSSARTRPAIVVSGSLFNGAGSDVILAAVTSNLQDTAYSVLFDDRDLASGKLPKPSRVKLGKLVTLDRRIIRRKIGGLKPAVLAQVMRELGAVFPEVAR